MKKWLKRGFCILRAFKVLCEKMLDNINEEIWCPWSVKMEDCTPSSSHQRLLTNMETALRRYFLINRIHLIWAEAKMYSDNVKWKISTSGVWAISGILTFCDSLYLFDNFRFPFALKQIYVVTEHLVWKVVQSPMSR